MSYHKMCSSLRIVLLAAILIALINGVVSLTKLTTTENEWIGDKCGLIKEKTAHMKIKTPPGRIAKEGQFPWVAMITIKNIKVEYKNIDGTQRKPTEIKPKQDCTGIVISPKHILTAAHCLAHQVEQVIDDKGTIHEGYSDASVKESDIEVTLGYTKHKITGQKVAVTKKMDFTGKRASEYFCDSDYTVIELAKDIRKLPIPTNPIVPLCLSNRVKPPSSQKYQYTLAAVQSSKPAQSIAYYDKYTLTQCYGHEQYSSVLCYLPAQNEPGDSGAPYMFYDKGRAYLHSVFIAEDTITPKLKPPTQANNGVGLLVKPHGVGDTMFDAIVKEIDYRPTF